MFTFDVQNLFRYLLQAFIIYLILRYVPYINLDQNKALLTTAILMIFYLVLEYIYSQTTPVNQSVMMENFKSIPCDSCKIEKFTSEGQNLELQNVNSNCKLVCNNPPEQAPAEQAPALGLAPVQLPPSLELNNPNTNIERVPQLGLGYDSVNGFVGITCNENDNQEQYAFDRYNNSWPIFRYGDRMKVLEAPALQANIYDFVPPYDDYDLLPIAHNPNYSYMPGYTGSPAEVKKLNEELIEQKNQSGFIDSVPVINQTYRGFSN